MTRAAALFAVMAVLAGCTGAQPQKKKAAQDDAPIQARCNEQPQWTTKDEKGEDIGIYICFGKRSQLLYAVRVLPKPDPKDLELQALRAELQKAKEAVAAPAAPPPAPAPEGITEHAAPERFAPPAPGEGVAIAPEPTPAPAELPTVTGTASEAPEPR